MPLLAYCLLKLRVVTLLVLSRRLFTNFSKYRDLRRRTKGLLSRSRDNVKIEFRAYSGTFATRASKDDVHTRHPLGNPPRVIASSSSDRESVRIGKR